MTKIAQPDKIVYGPRASMLAEYGVPEYYEGAWLVYPVGDGQWDAEGYSSRKAARQGAIALSLECWGAKVESL